MNWIYTYIYIYTYWHSSIISPFTFDIEGGHNYAFDIALGLHDASVALSLPMQINLLGYALAEKYPSAAEHCQQPGNLAGNLDAQPPERAP